jgi:hypothetical protein
MRKCIARAWVRRQEPGKKGKKGYWAFIQGVFHQFGTQVNDIGYPYTIALVEDIEGQVWECAADSVKFEE